MALHDRDGVRILDPLPMLEGLLGDLASGIPARPVSMRFHWAILSVRRRRGDLDALTERGLQYRRGVGAACS